MGTLLLTHLTQIVTCGGTDDRAVLSGHAVAINGERICDVAPEAELIRRYADAQRTDCGGGVLTPGFVDSHTHAVFGRFRADEYAMRSRGVSYMDIARRGGGINASVTDLRARSPRELVEITRPRLTTMLRSGTTTAEVKSGYGLRTEDELNMLRAVRVLHQEGPLDLVPTFLGAHEFPQEYRERQEEYVDLVVGEMIPAVAAENLAVFCDVFMEPGVFNAQQTRRILEAGLRHGLIPKLHADELEGSCAAELAVSLNAASADHLGAVSEAGIQALAQSSTVATLLPATLLYLGRTSYAPARRLLDAGATVALASDFNPGSAPSPSLRLTLLLACTQMGMHPLEALVAVTAAGARALRLDDRGVIRTGALADLVLWDVRDYREVPYCEGFPLIGTVWKRGRQVSRGE